MADLSVGTGLATGINYNELVSQLMYLERSPQRVLENKKKTMQSQVDILQKLKDSLSSFKSLVAGFNTGNEFMSKTATSSDDKKATVTANSTAMQGSHVIKIKQLAQSQIQVSGNYASATDTTTFAAGSFEILSSAAGATPVTVTTTSSTSLEGMASAINSAKAGVTASVVNDGSGSPYRLVVTGNDGNSYTFQPGGGVVPFALAETQAAKQAIINVDGIDNITKSSNTITDVLPGVTLTLLQGPAATDPPGTTVDVTINVNNDTEGVKKKVNEFVTKYNEALTQINKQSEFDASKKKGGALSGDSTLRTIKSDMQQIVSSGVPGLTGSYRILSSVGISTQKDGTLKVDDAKLSEALSKDFTGVIDLFTLNAEKVYGADRSTYGVAEQFNQILDKLTKSYIGPSYNDNGIIATRINGLTSSMKDIDERVASMELRMVEKEKNLKKQFTNLERTVSSLSNMGSRMMSILSRY